MHSLDNLRPCRSANLRERLCACALFLIDCSSFYQLSIKSTNSNKDKSFFGKQKKSNLWATLLIANILQKVTLMHCIFEPVTAPQSEALIYTVTKLIASYRIKLDDFRSQ